MQVRSWRGVAIGAGIALTVPVAFFLLTALISAGIAPYEPMHDLLNVFGLFGWAALLVFGPLGLAILGWSAGVRGVLNWTATTIVVVPLFIVFWFAAFASLSGALGNPA